MDDLTFRVVKNNDSADLALLEAFFDQMGAETSAFFNHGNENRIFMRNSLCGKSDTKDIHWVAILDGRVVGYVFLIKTDHSNPWLGIAVSEDMKGRHLGTKLIDLAKGYSRKEGKGGIFLTTHIANIRGQRLYEKCGFIRLGVHTSGEFLYFWDVQEKGRE